MEIRDDNSWEPGASPSRTAPAERLFQFGLRHLFMFVTAAASYCAIERIAGPLLPLLVLGMVVIATVIKLLRIENLIVGALVGTASAVPVVVLILAVVRTESWMNAMLAFGFPLAGYGIGMACAADRAFRSW